MTFEEALQITRAQMQVLSEHDSPLYHRLSALFEQTERNRLELKELRELLDSHVHSVNTTRSCTTLPTTLPVYRS